MLLMKDRISSKARHVSVPDVLEVVKERLVERRFNIEQYNRIEGTILGRRNRLDKIIVGLYRRVVVRVEKEKKGDKKNEISITMEWSGAYSASAVTFFEAGLISLAILKDLGFKGFLLSVLVGSIGALINMIAFNLLRVRMNAILKQDIRDLEEEAGERKGRGKGLRM